MKVVIRYFAIFSNYGICHAKSYQNAFGSSVNKFETREQAIEFCDRNGCKVELHTDDPLQQ